jgi:alkanesulfonate monooxygenase SsuD/methylene tetrahydromethanopterin reductase-like flavin-dependent oxidoreductase (luciferase family)
MFIMRFDMRAPGLGSATTRELYRAATEMARWAEERGCTLIVISEHHGSEDGYLPSPLILASAIAGTTTTIGIQIAALVLPLHDPVRMAEDMAVLDLISGGRISYVTAVGYVPSEYAMFGRDFKGRGKRMDECLDVLAKAFTGDPFDYRGETILVRPRPHTPGGPSLLMGGNSRAAARRAARFDMGMLTQGLNPEIGEYYSEQCRKLGREPKICLNPPPDTVTSAFIAEDVDRAWEEMGPYLLHDAQAYAAWMEENTAVSKSVVQTVDELRASRGPYQIYTPEEAVEYIRGHGALILQPLCGGMPPKLAWQSLRLLAERVLPELAAG